LLCTFLYLPIILFLFNPSIHLKQPLLKHAQLCPSLNVRNQVSYQYKITGKIIVPYPLIFMFLESRWKDGRCWTEW
jgi:hypothetical protein